MSSASMETASALDLNDSGCVQDSSVCENGYKGHAQLLDLSDDVLLFILKYCSPRDLKALGFTCPRLGALVCDHTLWHRVDCRDYPTGQLKLRWYLTHCLSEETTELKLKGYVNPEIRCLGMVNYSSRAQWQLAIDSSFGERLPSLPFMNLPRFTTTPSWPENIEMENPTLTKGSGSEDSSKSETGSEAASSTATDAKNITASDAKNITASCSQATSSSNASSSNSKDIPKVITCPGPHFVLTAKLMRSLKNTCPNLTALYLEYCDLDYRTGNLSQFPRHLKKLSLKGSRCFNQPLHTSYFCKVHDYLVNLEYLDVSYCEWFEPAALMPLSKVPKLQELHMCYCERLTECVAYTALAARYGFHELRVLSARGSPLADSEVSALGWLPRLRELRLAPAAPRARARRHAHRTKPPHQPARGLDAWETQEPEYYKCKSLDTPDVMPEEEANPAPNDGVAEVQPRAIVTSAPHEQSIFIIQPSANREMMTRPRILSALPMEQYPWPQKRHNPDTPLNLVKRRRYGEYEEEDDPDDLNSDDMDTWIHHSCYYDLVTDSAILMFGRGENEHVVHIGVAPPNEPRMRPDKSSLQVLYCTGFRNITNRSLVHLATAAPHLRLVDFSETNVTEDGVAAFKALKPDCEIKYSKFVDG